MGIPRRVGPPERIVAGAIVITGDADDPVLARVVSLTERPSGTRVQLELPPNGSVETP